jgi:L-ascorbate metabolism protein UlaG (beta-lactamase superfamily)
MDIVWLGHSSFRIKGKEATVITDPFDKTLGYPTRKLTANIVTVSHGHPQHSFVEGVGNGPRVVDRPGEYAIANVFINGIATFHDASRGELRGKNTAFVIEIEDVRICHLGDIGHVPTSAQIEQMSGADILMVPVGGLSTLGAAQAAETISVLAPRLVIPMHYRTEVVSMELDPLDRFLKEMALQETAPQPKLSVTKSSLPAETKVLVLDYH